MGCERNSYVFSVFSLNHACIDIRELFCCCLKQELYLITNSFLPVHVLADMAAAGDILQQKLFKSQYECNSQYFSIREPFQKKRGNSLVFYHGGVFFFY